MTSLFPLRKPTYPQSFMLIYGFFFELWVSNLNEKKKKKMKNSAHHSPIHKALLCFVIGMAKVLPIIDVLGYDEQISSFSSSPPHSDSTPITQEGSHIST